MFQKIFILLQFIQFLTSSSFDTFGENIIMNGNFSQPQLNGLPYKTYGNIPGWTCQKGCEINDCFLQNKLLFIQRKIFGDCQHQILDLSALNYGIIFQQFEALAGSYLLQLQFLLPTLKSNAKTLLVLMNGIEIYRFKPLFSFDFHRYNFSLLVQTKQGINSISFNMQGFDDSYGYRVISVSLRRIIDDQFERIVEKSLNSSLLQSAVKVPAIKMLLGQLVNFFVSFDRLQLYFYHNRDYSYYNKMFLQKVSSLLSLKGAFSQQIIDKFFEKVNKYTQNFIQKFNNKWQYLGLTMKNKPAQGMSFIQNNKKIIFYSLPFYLALMIIFNLIFRVTAKLKISKAFRKYCLMATFLLMMFDGNIEQFSFYLFGQINSMFSFSFYQKFVNIFIIFFLFLLLFVATTLYLWLKILYSKLSNCLLDDVSLNYIGAIEFSLDNGIFCLILGALHQNLIDYPNEQLLALASVQICWIFFQINGLYQGLYKSLIFVFLSICQGILRIVFMVFIYLFQLCKENAYQANFINSSVHRTIIILFLVLWCIVFITSIIQLMIIMKSLLTSSQTQQNVKISEKHQNISNFLLRSKNIAVNRYYDVVDKKYPIHNYQKVQQARKVNQIYRK